LIFSFEFIVQLTFTW